MLNELYSMSQSLERCGLKFAGPHKALQKNRKTDGFILGIDDEGLVASMEFCGKEKMERLWKIDSGEAGVTFPGFKIAGPLWSIDYDNRDVIEALLKLKKDATTERASLIERLLEAATFIYSAAENKQKRYVRNNLRDFPKKLLPVFDDCPPDYLIIRDLLKRLTESTVSEEDFLKRLSTLGLTVLRQVPISGEVPFLLQNFLIGKWDKKKRKFGQSEMTVVLEPEGGLKYPFAITHPNTDEFVNERLNLRMAGTGFAKGGKGAVIKTAMDSLRGIEAEIETSLPNTKLPVIKLTKLFSMTKDSLAQTRYGLQESDIFPVGKDTSRYMLDALNFVTKEERKGKTWKGIANSEGGRDLLIVYLEDRPDASVSLADYFALDSDQALSQEAQFEETAAKVCAALDGDPAISPDSLLRVIVLSSRDQGRQQVALNECYQVKEIIRSAEEWRQAGRNLPLISLPLTPKQGEKPKMVSARCPHPATLLTVFNTQWTNEGMKKSWVSSCDLGQVYEIFLRQSARSESTAERLLTLTLQRTGGLLLALGNRLDGGKWKDFPDQTRLVALTAASALGILLFKTTHRKEEFMKQSPFNIGRLLSLADQLHALYCMEVRGGRVPQQLFGNALMSTALQQPVTAFSLFAGRVLPYHAWANTAYAKDNDDESKRKRIGRAKNVLKEIESVSTILNETKIPTTLTDAERAEMILGYLANPKAGDKETQQLNSKGEEK